MNEISQADIPGYQINFQPKKRILLENNSGNYATMYDFVLDLKKKAIIKLILDGYLLMNN